MSALLSKRKIWGAPLALGIASAVGLIAALLADGLGDTASWIALTVPVIVCIRGMWRSDSSNLNKRETAPERKK